MTEAELAAQTPENIDEALVCMQRTLEVFRSHKDRRAAFLHVYLLMTRAVHAAVEGTGDFEGRPVFMDPEWIRRLSGIFATRYFASLGVADSDDTRWAWKLAHGEARKHDSPVLLDVLLGINAHINYDLAQAIAANLDPAELHDPSALRRRKFDHDQVNNLLNRSISGIQKTLERDYEPVLAVGDHLFGHLDEQLSQVGLKHYRQEVWENALTMAAAQAEDAETGGGSAELVRAKLDWESKHLAKEILSWVVMWRMERGAATTWNFLTLRV